MSIISWEIVIFWGSKMLGLLSHSKLGKVTQNLHVFTPIYITGEAHCAPTPIIMCSTILNPHKPCIISTLYPSYPYLSAEGELLAFERGRGDVARVQAATNQVEYNHFDDHDDDQMLLEYRLHESG